MKATILTGLDHNLYRIDTRAAGLFSIVICLGIARCCAPGASWIVQSPQTRTPPEAPRQTTPSWSHKLECVQVPRAPRYPHRQKTAGQSLFSCACWMIPAWSSRCRPGKLILSVVVFSRRLQLCVVRWPSLQPHRVQCYAAESLSRACSPSCCPARPLSRTSRASSDKRSRLTDCPCACACAPWSRQDDSDPTQVWSGQPSITVTVTISI